MKEILLNRFYQLNISAIRKKLKYVLNFTNFFLILHWKEHQDFRYAIPFSDFSLEHEITKEVRCGGLDTKSDEE